MPSVDTHVTAIQLNPETEWYRITLDDERIKVVETKRTDLAEEAVAIKKSGQLARIEYSERDSRNINPHTNKPYVNRYYEKGTTLGSAPAAIDGVDVVTPPSRKTDPGDAWRMCLNKGGELAVATMPMMPVEQRTFEVQQRIAFAWASFFYFTPAPAAPSAAAQPSVFQTPAGAVSAGSGQRPGAYDDPPDFESAPPHGDDDIPF